MTALSVSRFRILDPAAKHCDIKKILEVIRGIIEYKGDELYLCSKP